MLLQRKSNCAYLNHSKNVYSARTIQQLLQSARFQPGEIQYYEPLLFNRMGPWSAMLLVVARKADCQDNSALGSGLPPKIHAA